MLFVQKNGAVEPFKVEKFLHRANHACRGLEGVDALHMARVSIAGLRGTVAREVIIENLVSSASRLSKTTPSYQRVASRLLSDRIALEVGKNFCFTDYLSFMEVQSGTPWVALARTHLQEIEWALDHERDTVHSYDELREWSESHLLRNPNGKLTERPQWMLMRTALSRSDKPDEAIRLYHQWSQQPWSEVKAATLPC